MSRSIIYTVDPAGGLTAMRPAAPRSEDAMQDLVARYPELIADADGPLILIRREQPIADELDGGGRWSLDHLFATRSGIPVLVELKRATDTRLRREVIGQMLDYAANATVYWQAGRIAQSFAASMATQGRDANAVLAEFLGGAVEPEEFWNQVDANFSAGRIKIVFVADVIPRELARIVEFLNEQMRADVRAVELSWFQSEGGVMALAPRVIGETERAQATKGVRDTLAPISREAWIEEKLGPLGGQVLQACEKYIALVERLGGEVDVTKPQASLYAKFETPQGGLYPLMFTLYRRGSIQLCLGYLLYKPAFATEAVRQALYDRFVSIVGPLSTRTLSGFPSFPATQLNDPGVLQELGDALQDILEQAGDDPAPSVS